MENTPSNIHTMPPTPNSKSNTFLWIILSIILTAIIIGGGFFLYRQHADSRIARLQTEKERIETEQKAVLANKVLELEDVVEKLSEEKNAAENKEEVITFVDERILVATEEDIQQIVENEIYNDEVYNTDPANTTILYKNEDKGYSIRIPYNPSWGSKTFRVSPYDDRVFEQNDTLEYRVAYGPLVRGEGGVARQYNIIETEAKPASDLIDTYTADPNKYGYSKDNPATVKNINGLEVVEYLSTGLCDSSVAVVIGEKYNYEFVGNCINDFKFFEDVIESFKFL